MNEKTDKQIKDEFTLRLMRQRISYLIYLFFILVIFLIRGNSNLAWAFIGVFVVYSLMYLVYFQWNWRCPSCNNHLDGFFNKKSGVNPFFHSKIVHCPYCEKLLR